MKVILYQMYAVLFYICRLLPIDRNKTTFIMTHDNSINGNIMRMYQEIKEKSPHAKCYFIERIKGKTKWHKLLNAIKFWLKTPYDLATSKVIFLDNVFLPMAFIKFKDEVKIVQLWHGCNTLKRFGQLSNTGRLKVLEKEANACYTHVIVSGKNMIPLHEAAFGVDHEIIYPLGLPRMDLFFDRMVMQELRERFFEQFPELRDKKIILYAPTFRDNDLDMLNSNMDLRSVAEKLPEEYVILAKFHPFVVAASHKWKSKRVLDFTTYEDLSTLLIVADVLITDYSSIVFDYALLNKPILFYAYDKEDYKQHIRGFYYDYESYVGKAIVEDKSDLVDAILHADSLGQFSLDYIDYKDNESTKRIYDEIYKN